MLVDREGRPHFEPAAAPDGCVHGLRASVAEPEREQPEYVLQRGAECRTRAVWGGRARTGSDGGVRVGVRGLAVRCGEERLRRDCGEIAGGAVLWGRRLGQA